MKTNLKCLPCFLNQTISSLNRVTSDDLIKEEVINTVLKKLSNLDYGRTPPETGRYIQNLINKTLSVSDPFHEIKHLYNNLLKKMVPGILSELEKSENRFDYAVRLAIAGNIIDFGNQYACNEEIVSESINQALKVDIIGNTTDEFHQIIKESKKILFIGDNCGEVFLDKILIQEIGIEKITFAVRGMPILNDITREDAEFSGISSIIDVIDTGSDIPGVVLSESSEEFLNVYNESDLIIAKGQGNFETLSDEKKQIAFLFKAKCDVIASYLNVPLGSMILSINKGD